MKELTSRERYKRLFKGEPIDRIPVCPRVFENVVFERHQTKDLDILEKVAEYYRYFGMDIIDWMCTPAPHFEMTDFTVEGPNWHPSTEEKKEGKTTHILQKVKTPKGELRRVITATVTGPFEEEKALTETPIKSEKDFDLIEEFMPEPYTLDTENWIKKMQRIIGEDGITSPSFHGPFNILAYCYRKFDALLMDLMENPKFYHRMMRYFTDRIKKYAKQMMDADCDMVDIGANMANGLVVSPTMLVDEIMPYENELADFIQEKGIPCLYHNCGYAKNHLGVYHKLHHKVWGYLAPKPHGDTVLEEAIEKLPREMILWGHVDQIDFLRKATPAEIDARVKYCCETMKPRGNYILGTTDYLEVGTPEEIRSSTNPVVKDFTSTHFEMAEGGRDR